MILIDYIKKYIKDNNINDSYFLEGINTLSMYYYNINFDKFLIKQKEEISNEEMQKLGGLFDKLVKEDIPVEYVTNVKFFYNEKYYVDENVLIPRDDTEILVEQTIKLINKNKLEKMLDMCTGTGCIGISVCNNSSIKEVVLLDISKEALKIANKNISLNNCNKNITTLNSDLFENVDKNMKFDIITSNPPYIKSEVITSLDSTVKKEPIIALDGGSTGLNIYKRIIKDASNYLNDNGFLVFEIGYDQRKDLTNCIEKNSNFEYIDCIKDYSNNDRVVICRFHQM